MELTKEQQAAVSHQLAHARVVAVAGAGKTATLTHYIAARLAAPGPGEMLILMYNRAVQQAFAQRLRLVCGQHLALPQVRTFHALGLHIYKRLISDGWLSARHLQPLSEVVIEMQLKQLLQGSSKAHNLIETPEQLQEWVELCRQFIVLVKSDIEPAEEALRKLAPSSGGDAVLLEVFNAFESWRQQHHAITYDDMLYDPAQVFLHQPQSRKAFADVFDEILVDEYQDINPIQHFILQVVAGSRAQVMVIGDPDQTIYEFRGSSPQFITRYFARDFEAPETYCLTRTFRFGHALALCANQLISRNSVREPILTISADNTPQSKVHLAQCDNHGTKIVKTIALLNSKGGPYSGMAVLCRLWSYARPVELELMAQGIPYRIEGEQSILQCAEIRPFLHALDLISGEFVQRTVEHRQRDLFDLLTIPSLKIPHVLLRRICATWARTITSSTLTSSQSFIKALPTGLKPYQQRTLEVVASALRQLSDELPCATALRNYSSVLDIVKRLRESALNPERGQEQARTVTAFLQFVAATPAQSAAELRSFLEQMQNSQPTDTDAVTLTTIHRSKGLEWPVVFLPNVAEGHLPCGPSGGRQRLENERCRIESERRLMYVAITRAQKQLFITVPTNASNASVSRFVKEMNIPLSQAIAKAIYQQQATVAVEQEPGPIVNEYLNKLNIPLGVQVLPAAHSPAAGLAPAPSSSTWCIGDRVQHTVLGLGNIRALDDGRIHIQFDDGKMRVFHGDLALPHLALTQAGEP